MLLAGRYTIRLSGGSSAWDSSLVNFLTQGRLQNNKKKFLQLFEDVKQYERLSIHSHALAPHSSSSWIWDRTTYLNIWHNNFEAEVTKHKR